MTTLRMLDPVSPRRQSERNLGAPRLAGMSGVVGLLHNGKPGGAELLEGVRRALADRYDGIVFDARAKKDASVVAPFLDDVEPLWDAAVVAVGDCGSCSSYAVMDGIELEKRGVPSVVIVSRPFEQMSHLWATQFDVPDLSVVVVDHPLAHLDAEVLNGWGAAQADAVTAGLLGSTDRA